MNDTWIWVVIAGLTGVTVLTRCTLLLLGDRLRMPPRVAHALRYAPICALAALIAPAVVDPSAGWPGTVMRPEFAGGVVALLAMRLTRSMIATMAIGMAAYLAVAFLLR